jgi:hypothetical protein
MGNAVIPAFLHHTGLSLSSALALGRAVLAAFGLSALYLLSHSCGAVPAAVAGVVVAAAWAFLSRPQVLPDLRLPPGSDWKGLSTTTINNNERRPLRCVVISDTHGHHRELRVPDGDVLLHCGDFSNRGRLAEVRDFNEWLGMYEPERGRENGRESVVVWCVRRVATNG